MRQEQFDRLLAYLEIIAQNTAVIAAQGHSQRPLTGLEHGQSAESVRQVAESLAGGLEMGVLPPGGV